MTEHERNQTPEPRPDAKEQDNASPSRGMSRRRFSQAALGSVPVLMTLYSNPLRASNGNGGNCNPSGWVSGNVSRHGDAVNCNGKSTGYWGNEGNGGGSDDAKEEDFNDVFGYSPGTYTDDNDNYLNLSYAAHGNNNNIVKKNGYKVSDSDRRVIRFGSAAYMSSTDSSVEYLGPGSEQIREMVTDALDNGYYKIPGTGDELSKDGVAAFFKNTINGNSCYEKDCVFDFLLD